MFKQGDIVRRKEGMWKDIGATALEPFDKFTVTAYFADQQYPTVIFKESGSYQWDAAYFELAKEEKVKNRFAVGDKVISIIDVTGVPEGYIGHVVKIRDKLSFPIVVRKEGTDDERVFNEDELELLSVGGKEKIQQLKEEARIIFDDLVDKDYPFNRDDITPQDIAGVSKSALDKQVGGGHYKEKGIQPIEYIFANNLGFCEANIVKYATRWKDKNGIQDLEKIIHYTELLIELTKKEESKDKEGK